MTRPRRTACALAISSLVMAAPALAQLPTGAIRGQIADAQGGVVPGVTVTITQAETGLVRTAVTNESGVYRIAGLPSGKYEVVTELQSFERRRANVDLALNQEAELNFTLALAGRSEEVNVVASNPIIETAKSEMSRTYSERMIRDLPLAGRNYLNLAFLAPGVSGGASSTGGQQGIGASVNGQRARNVNFIIDGSDNNDASVTIPRTPIIQDAVAEFRIVTSLFSAEVGRNTGAVAIASTRSGTNAFHGTAYEFFEDAESLNARNNLEIQGGLTKPAKLRRDTYGFSVGGPVQRDRTFFFGAFQHRALDGAPAQVPLSSPTEAGRAALATVSGADPRMLELLRLYVPLPNSTAGARTIDVSGVSVPVANYIASVPLTEDENQTVLRVDRTLSSSDSIFGRYIYARGEILNQVVANQNVPGFGVDQFFPTHNFVATWNRVMGSSMLNELHFSYGRTGGLFPGSESNPAGNNDLSTVVVTSLFNVGLPNTFPQDRTEQVYQITDNISFLRGNHAFKVGGDLRYVDLTSSVPFDFRGTYTYSTLQRFITNSPNTLLMGYGLAGLPFQYLETFLFAQDDWKLSPALTLNLGMRYERVGAAEGFYSNVSTDNNNFAPRVGFAWDMTGRGNTILRGGYGIAYDQFFLNIPVLVAQSPPFQRRITDVTGLTRYPNLPPDRELTPAELKTLNRLDVPDDAKTPYSQQWQLGVQRQFGQTWRAEVAYVGSRGLKLIRQRILNPVICCPRVPITGPTGIPTFQRHGDPEQTGTLTNLETSASSNYHAGQFSLDKRFSAGFSVSAAYTWSKFIDDASESLNTGTPSVQVAQDQFNLEPERALSSFDRPHRFVLGWVYELPFYRDQQGALGRILGGWQIAGNYTAQSGQPFSIFTGVDSNGDGVTTNDRPNPATGDRTLASSYEPRPEFSGGNGTLGRNTERGPGVNTWNAVFMKNVRVFGDHQVQVRAEVFNVLNHQQYSMLASGADRNLTSPTFYTFTGSTGGLREPRGPNLNSRTMILGVKYLF
jgi:Carboxypeptidase regulatory-like domain/TonB dependent receptor-like, beta-barrel